MHWKGNYTQNDPICIQNLNYCQELHVYFCAVFRKLGPKDINPFFCHQISFYLKQETEYVCHVRKNIIFRELGWWHWVRVQVCPHSYHICMSWRMKKMSSISQAWLSTVPLPPELWGSVTFNIKDGVLVFNTLNYSLINRLLLQIKIQIWHKPIWFVPIVHINEHLMSVCAAVSRFPALPQQWGRERCQHKWHCFVL